MSDFERIMPHNNVKTDQMLMMVETEELVRGPMSKDIESFSYEFHAEGFHLELFQSLSCMTRRYDDHLNPSCPT